MQNVPTRGWFRCAVIVSGFCAGMTAHLACDPGGREAPCALLADIHTIVVKPGPYHVRITVPDLPAMEQSSEAVVEGDTITLAWVEEGVEHRIAWQLVSFEWADD